MTTMTLIPQVVDAVDVPVIAAGGIGDSRGVCAAFALGAQAVQMGTRFVMSEECIAHENYKNLVLKARDRSTVVTGRSTGHPTRVLQNKLTRIYLEKEAAKALMKAQKILHQKYPDYNLKVCDAARPMHIQAQMWKVVENSNKQRYVSNPSHGGGLHNFGLAVDITVVDKNGK